jgi:hypothetical protein
MFPALGPPFWAVMIILNSTIRPALPRSVDNTAKVYNAATEETQRRIERYVLKVTILLGQTDKVSKAIIFRHSNFTLAIALSQLPRSYISVTMRETQNN